MSTRNHLYMPTTGKDPKKFDRVPALETEPGKPLFKHIASGFRLAGKVSDYLRTNAVKWKEVPSGWNGYGYTELDRYILVSRKDVKVVMDMLNKRESAVKPDEYDLKEAWCRKLVKLTGISMDTARKLAWEKLAAKERQIAELEERQDERGYSVRRERLINKIRRENPLRRIRDEEHAMNILRASARHNNSDYDDQLEIAHKKAFWREIDPALAKEYARSHTTYTGDISVFFPDNNDNQL